MSWIERRVGRAYLAMVVAALASAALVWSAWDGADEFARRLHADAALGFGLVCLAPLLAWRLRWLLPVALTGWLLVTLSLLITPLYSHLRVSRYLTLPRDWHQKVRVVGDVMPGFAGVNTVSTDARGFRVNRPVDYDRKPAGVLRIAAIGGSTTEQIFLDDRETWTHLLADRIERDTGRRVEMINTGVSGLRAEHHLRTLRALRPAQLDAAIFLMGLNDWNRHIRDAAAQRGESLSVRTWGVRFEDSPLIQTWVLMREARERRRERAAGDAVLEYDGRDYAAQNHSLDKPQRRSVDIRAVSPGYEAAVRAILDECKAMGIRCLFLDQPTAYRADVPEALRQRFWMTPPHESYTLTLDAMIGIAGTYNRWLLKTAAEAGMPTCEIGPDVAASPAHFYDDCHFNEGGAARVAQLVGQCVARQGLLR